MYIYTVKINGCLLVTACFLPDELAIVFVSAK